MKVLSFIRKMVGASAGADGRSGYVPKPLAGQHGYALFGDGTYKALPGGGDMLAANDLAEINTLAKRAAARVNLGVPSHSDILARQWSMAGHVKFTSTIAGQKAIAFIPGLNIGRGDFTVSFVFRVPATNPPATRQVFTIGSSSTSQTAYGVRFYIATTGAASWQHYGATVDVDMRFGNLTTNLVTAYGGQLVRVTFSRINGTLACYLNKATETLSESTSGTPPDSLGDTIKGQYLFMGGGASLQLNEEFIGLELFNYGLTAEQVGRLVDFGVDAHERFGQVHGMNAIANEERNGLFTAAATDWAGTAGLTTCAIDPANDELDCVSGAGGGIAYLSSTHLAQVKAGSLYRLRFTVRNAASLGLSVKLYDGNTTLPGAPIQTIASGITGNGFYDYEFTPVAGVFALGFELGATDTCSLTNISLTQAFLPNGSFETAGSGGADVLGSWSEAVDGTGTSTVNRDTTIYKTGVASLRMDIDAANKYASIQQQNCCVIGQAYKVGVWVRHNKGVAIDQLQFDFGVSGIIVTTDFYGNAINIPDLTWTWVEMLLKCDGTVFTITRPSGALLASKSIWYDGLTLTPIGTVASFTPWGLDKDTSLWRNQALTGDATLVGSPVVVTGPGRSYAEEGVLGQISRELTARAGGGIYFDGHASQRVNYALTTAQAIGANDVWFEATFTVPASNPGSNRWLLAASSSSAGAFGAGGLFLVLTNLGTLAVQLVGATGSDSRQATFSNFVSLFGGKRVQVVFCRTAAGALNGWINGNPFLLNEGTAAASPAWNASVTSTYIIGPVTHVGEVFTWRLGRGVITDALAKELFENGPRNVAGSAIGAGGTFAGAIDGVVINADLAVGAGQQVPDKSGNGFHGTNNHTTHRHLVPRRQLQVRGRVATNVTTQLNGAKCIPANARISSIVINCASGTPTVDIGNAASGEQIVKDWVLATGRNEASADGASGRALASRFSSTENLYITSSTSDQLDITINAELAD